MTVEVSASNSVATCAIPGSDPAAAAHALHDEVAGTGLVPPAEIGAAAHRLVALAGIYGNTPFMPLEQARREIGLDRVGFARLLELFGRIPGLRTAVENGPSGRYWSNTVLGLEKVGVLDAVLDRRPTFPHLVGLYPGPTCMFRCHFCVRVTGARYQASALDDGNAMFASLIDEVPAHNRDAMYVSGGLEPLTNPGLGALVSRGAGRGFRIVLYTNSFALTEQKLKGEQGLWNLHAIRTSLYGLNDEEYRATTGKQGAFTRVRANLTRFQQLRAERAEPVRLGLSYIVLPGRAGRLSALVDFIAELNEAAPDRPLDYINLREDYSGRPDGKLSPDERAELQAELNRFRERAAERTPTLHIDYGYALHSLMTGTDVQLVRIRPETMRPTAHPQVSVQVDLLGDVYLYREAAFPGLAGAQRYRIGTVSPDTSLAQVVETFVTSGGSVVAEPGDEYFLDGFDQAVTARLNQMETDIADGWGNRRGFLR
ncbi:dTDP-4-amino-4,6-dideoxy-D-glucose ammonia-lyase [Micromonospora sp. KC207]|uniref:dTDP-4-amino-4,6-dideoxy-D-glucose ammonia-lyase n=1 Tax=Micromonospora sp. KC207 TaxID=2530377 RepID=UPI00104CABC8|nr:dTDP-4-amino-4,6-dideoxy-D-glucose ammonia-lyase [Micromonospora sp. KC207]TDC61643.1 dTDP-4-amino-4,6-dideoxy-D-glucose ammonia-lyase [Micromonospora sp. KC207]